MTAAAFPPRQPRGFCCRRWLPVAVVTGDTGAEAQQHLINGHIRRFVLRTVHKVLNGAGQTRRLASGIRGPEMREEERKGKRVHRRAAHPPTTSKRGQMPMSIYIFILQSTHLSMAAVRIIKPFTVDSKYPTMHREV